MDNGKGVSVKDSSITTEIDLLSKLDPSKLEIFSLEDIHTLQQRGYLIKDGLLGMEQAVAVRKECEALQEGGCLKPAGMGREGKWNETTLRGDFITWLEVDRPEKEKENNVEIEEGSSLSAEGFPEGSKQEESKESTKESPRESRESEESESSTEQKKRRVAVASQGEALRMTQRRLAQVAMELRAACGVGVPADSSETCLGTVTLQLAAFPPQRRYTRHVDAFPGGPNRLLTLIYYLNPQWQPSHGGQLRLFLPEGPCDVNPVADRLLVFFSPSVEHEVLLSNDMRFALTMWMY